METSIVLWLPLLVALLGGGVGDGKVGLDGKAASNTVREAYIAEIGVQEASGNNDGPRVAEYLRHCGLGEGYEWCAAFVSWCHGKAGYPAPRNAWAAALFPARRTIWANGRRAPGRDRPRAGDVFGIYMASKKRIGHCGFVDEWEGGWCITVEGNVGDAVVRKRRPVRTIRVVARWVE